MAAGYSSIQKPDLAYLYLNKIKNTRVLTSIDSDALYIDVIQSQGHSELGEKLAFERFEQQKTALKL